MKSPRFWYKKSVFSLLLAPFSWLYTLGFHLRNWLSKPYTAPFPVICVGNLTLGGSGKTPIVEALQKELKKQGVTPHVVSRGYGGTPQKTPVLVDPHTHSAQTVGDEPLLLSQNGPVWVCTNKKHALEKAEENGAGCVLLDDGFQNPTVHKDLSLVVIGSLSSLGNHAVFPAGPLREPLESGFKRASAILTFEPEATLRSALNLPNALPVFSLKKETFFTAPPPQNVIAFCGLGFPEQFYRSLGAAGLSVLETHTFPDHHFFSEEELTSLQNHAHLKNAPLVCTEKDWIKLPKELQKQVIVAKQALHLPETFWTWYKKEKSINHGLVSKKA